MSTFTNYWEYIIFHSILTKTSVVYSCCGNYNNGKYKTMKNILSSRVSMDTLQPFKQKRTRIKIIQLPLYQQLQQYKLHSYSKHITVINRRCHGHSAQIRCEDGASMIRLANGFRQHCLHACHLLVNVQQHQIVQTFLQYRRAQVYILRRI